MARLPPIQSLSECPHCGEEEFYVVQVYSGRGVYYRRFDGYSADNTEMYNCLDHKVGRRAFCRACERAVASWDDDRDAWAYIKDEYASPRQEPTP